MRRPSRAHVSARLSPPPYTHFADLTADSGRRPDHHLRYPPSSISPPPPNSNGPEAALVARLFFGLFSLPRNPTVVCCRLCTVDNERDDFAGKLLLIEKQALLCLQDLPPGLFHDRIEEIATTAKLLRLRLRVAAGPFTEGKL